MRPIRLLILLLAIALALVLALVRPLQGRATRLARKHTPRPAKIQPVPRPLLIPHPLAAEPVPFGHRIVTYARHFLGIHYSWGGASPSTGFDCSGLVRFVYGHFGVVLPHSSFGDLTLGHRVSRRWLKPGDLVFFAGASHVGIYVGSGRFIDAPHTGAVVRISTMGEYGYYAARRLAHRG
jgi:cell wall-associated NlpC family hydrolase